jgi:hypothetical protein
MMSLSKANNPIMDFDRIMGVIFNLRKLYLIQTLSTENCQACCPTDSRDLNVRLMKIHPYV